MTVILSSRADLTLETARRAAWGGERVRLAKPAMTAMAEARARFERLLENPEVVIYGVTSGYGQMAHLRFTPEERRAHAKKHSTAPMASWGDPLPERAARAIVFARLANFIEGDAAITPAIAAGVAKMLDGPLPKVPTRGQGGAGEILSLSYLFQSLMAAHDLREKDTVCLINGSPSAAGLAVDAALAARARLDLIAAVLAFAAEAMNAPLGHYDPALAGQWNNPHDAWAIETLWRLLDGGHGGERRPYQAPVSYRIIPRILGLAHLACAMTEEIAAQSLASVSDNPVVLGPDEDHPHGRAISTGGYHNAQAAMAMDQITAAAANLCTLAGRLSDGMLDPAVSKLPPQLGMEQGLPYVGCLGMAITGYEEEARGLATATLIPGSAAGGFGQNDVASPVFLAWSKQERAAVLLEHCLACLATVAARAFLVTERPVPAQLTWLAEAVAEHVAHTDPATVLGPATANLSEALRGRVYDGAAT